jgi:hypothetical protein
MSSTLNGRGPIEFQAKAADYTVKTSESGSGFTNTGAAAVVTFALPAAVVGDHYYFYVNDTDGIRIDPNGTETISLPSSGVPGAAGKYLTADAIGESVHLVCAVAGSWAVFGYTGTWTAEG